MKKILFATVICLLTFLMALTVVHAEETTTLAPDDETTLESTEQETTLEETTTEDVTTNQEEVTTTKEETDEYEPTLDEFKAEVQHWLEQYMEESLVVKIITWLVDAGVLASLFVVYLKYRKYKNTTTGDLVKQFGEKMGGWLKDNFDKLSAEEIAKITKSIEDLESATETIMKVLVLMQDNTAKGKAALIDYLGSKTNSQEVKVAAEQVSESLEEQEKANEEVKSKVAGEYEEIF